MAQIPGAYPLPAETAVASYDYTDIAEGTGTVIYYGYNSKTSAATVSYHLSKSPLVYSADIETITSHGSASSAQVYDFDFDLPSFNLPQTIRGTAMVNSSYAVSNAAVNVSGWPVVRLRKWDGTSSSEVAVGTGEELTLSGADEITTSSIVLAVPSTHFKKGETLRLTMEMWKRNQQQPGSNDFVLAHDPKDRDGQVITKSTTDPDKAGTTILAVHIPFNLNL